ncbi:Ger(x)C family spore germination protein [Clostridium tagluense]|uniref:Ger(x)C family spore germination protein n=1 Tax=Clostridium tagluense TaxID=360422 RepID=UPI001C0B4D9E|nr:Ger(x)C family spore germination protein [Clostridium tagluense]MBU3127390.1 Ger(x)C family spore germination protein [Clostridium tagluense]MCB2311136.1 Ger(x)C family spore germination protein [Clostridium tagluense]MCB2315860.1 Ger(x)C family spore germination protein [Clostridium tagluense]MCB2320793.1 Ger(x)C family spore germination protein [Clostridium tagluense]MCB2325810.1 Ger(x)C family spore germination protein [Clostridium tagluense]
MKFKMALPIILSCVLLSGCWDKVEIDRLDFISTIAIDPGQDIGKEKELKSINPKEPFAEGQIKKINVTYGFPDMSMLGAGKGGSAQEKYINTQAYSMEDASSEAMAKSSRDIYMGHTKLLILSSNLLEYKDTVKEVVDYLQRNPNINRMMDIVVSDGKAEDYIKFKPMTENSTQYYISGLMANSKRNSRIMSINLNEFLILLSENGNALLPRITLEKEKNELILTGAAIINNYELKGYFNPLELMDIQLLSGKFNTGKKVIYIDGHPVDYIINGYERKMRVEEEGDKLVINIDLGLEGQINGYYVDKKILGKEELQSLQNTFNDSISVECEKIMKVAKEEFEIDPFGVREHIEKFKPSLWNKIEKDWKGRYKNAIVKVNVNTEIRRIGAVQ